MYHTNILEYLELTVREFPDRSSFADGEEDLCFFQLYSYARAVGSLLSERGYYRRPVVILADKKPRTVAAMLGVVYSGCFYACLDIGMPSERLERIFSALSPVAVLCDGMGAEVLSRLSYSGERYSFDEAFSHPTNEEMLARVRNRQIDTDPVYVVFTSGSTGVPKGVVASHRSVIDYTETLCEALDFSENCVFGNQAPLCFDAPLKEIMPTLKLGARTVFIPRRLFSYPVMLCEYLDRHGVNTVCWVSSALSLISMSGALDSHRPKYLDMICFGSEVFLRAEYEKWRAEYPHATFVNLYGPTEATGMSCYWIATRELDEGESIPIGRPFRNTEIMLIGEDGERAEEGEIYIRGTALTLGYLGDVGGSAFLPDPTNSLYFERVYRTGDIGRLNERGELVFVCRRDMQIKHMGHRIELGEIEAAAIGCGADRACAVYDSEARKITLIFTGKVDKDGLLRSLGGRLPRYALPARFLHLDAMPLTANGKLDRRLLAEMAKKT